MPYSEGLKERLVQRMLGEGVSAYSLAYEVGVPETTLRRWRHAARIMSSMSGSSSGGKPAKSPRQWSTAEKLRVVTEASGLSDCELGEFLRREGLHSSQLESWREQVESALASDAALKKRKSAEYQRIRELEREIQLKDKALAEVTALLTLSKKVRLLLGDEGDGTPESNEA